MHRIEFGTSAVQDLRRLRPYDRSTIVDAIERQLSNEPTVPTRQRKLLTGVEPPFEAVPPIWQLRVEDYRVFYDVDGSERVVYVRAVRKEPPHRTTEEIL